MVKYTGEFGQLVGIRLPSTTSAKAFDQAYDQCKDYFKRVEIVEDDDSVLIRSGLAWDAQQPHLSAEPA